MSFITDDFLLQSETARELYHNYAKDLPIIDYHCHLPPDEAAQNKQWGDLAEVWLGGDHYKWRLMRSNGVPEEFCTGNAPAKEKYLRFAATVPQAIRNPMYHWCHLELKRYFGIDDLINEKNAEKIWNEANEKLKTPELSAHGILERFKVSVVCTTDDPTDSLEHHKAIADSGIQTKIYPTFRPDKALKLEDGEAWNAWVQKLESSSDTDCGSFDSFLDALKKRHDFFHLMGGRLSDHGLSHCHAIFPSKQEAATIFETARSGGEVSPHDQEKFASYLMEYFGLLDHEKNWTKQLHLGAMRNNNSRLFHEKGPDIGFDSIGDWQQGVPLSRYLDRLHSQDKLPKTVLYNLNPNDNYLFATMIGNFQDGTVPGKLQFGSGWWFNDQLEGMTWQINALSNLGLLGRFVGMLTDSRSFLSYCRHEYFRRLLCNLIGQDVEDGKLPKDMDLLGSTVANISFYNAARFFGFGLGYTA